MLLRAVPSLPPHQQIGLKTKVFRSGAAVVATFVTQLGIAAHAAAAARGFATSHIPKPLHDVRVRLALLGAEILHTSCSILVKDARRAVALNGGKAERQVRLGSIQVSAVCVPDLEVQIMTLLKTKLYAIPLDTHGFVDPANVWVFDVLLVFDRTGVVGKRVDDGASDIMWSVLRSDVPPCQRAMHAGL